MTGIVLDPNSVLFQAFVYLLAIVIGVPLTKRMGLGAVLGYLLAGVIIGPFVLGWVGQNTPGVMHFAEFGVIMMLFLIGLELKPAMLWRLRTPILCMGGLQVLLSAIAIAIITLALGFSWSVAIAIGMILSLSSTAIVMQILQEKGWSHGRAGQTAFSILLFQDIAALPMMAIFPLLTAVEVLSPNHHRAAWQQALLVIVMAAVIILLGRFLLRPLFRFIAAAKLREAFTAMALFLVVAITLAMKAVGLSPALGTFLAGVVLAENEYRHELESNIEPFKGLLLGIFFISVGASINFAIILQHPFWIIGAVLSLLLIKCLVLMLLGKAFRFPWRDNLLLSMALAQGGEFCFVLLSYATEQQVLSQQLSNQLIAIVALSMLLTPMLVLIYEKWIDPRFNAPVEDKVSDLTQQHNPVVIAGFGRFGQIVGRLLLANGIHSTVLELDPNQVELLRKFGHKVFYGDAERLDLLHTAGLAKAKLFVLAIDDSEKALKIAEVVRQYYPHLKILVRVRGRTSAYEFFNAGFTSIYRETFSSSLSMGEEALRCLGFPAHHAHRMAKLFKQLDEKAMQESAPIYRDEQAYVNQAKLSQQNLEEVFAKDRQVQREYPEWRDRES